MPTRLTWKEYLRLLATVIKKLPLLDTRELPSKITVRRSPGGEPVQWKARFSLDEGAALLDVVEEVNVLKDRFEMLLHNYHFQPIEESLYSFRIDYHGGSLHVNPDGRLVEEKGYKEHMEYPSDHLLDIRDFNAILALYVALMYLKTKKYPIEDPDQYNRKIGELRREFF